MGGAGGSSLASAAEPTLALAFVTTLAAVTVTDIERRVIPNPVLVASAACAVGIVAVADPGNLPSRAAAAIAAGGVLFAAALIRPDGMGLGDVKLASVMGLYLGVAVAPALLTALALGAAAGGAIIARHGAAGRTRTIPFAPFLALGGIVAFAGGEQLVDWYLHIALQ
jgi:leader peptidase (prepilin peptidase)/N-methyltransferase